MLLKGILTKINPPFERGFYIRVLCSDSETHIVLTGKTTGLTVVRVSDITEKHVVRSLINLPEELSKHVAAYY
jgi:tRNA U55 pseudouridine synthase TruB